MNHGTSRLHNVRNCESDFYLTKLQAKYTEFTNVLHAIIAVEAGRKRDNSDEIFTEFNPQLELRKGHQSREFREAEFQSSNELEMSAGRRYQRNLSVRLSQPFM